MRTLCLAICLIGPLVATALADCAKDKEACTNGDQEACKRKEQSCKSGHGPHKHCDLHPGDVDCRDIVKMLGDAPTKPQPSN